MTTLQCSATMNDVQRASLDCTRAEAEYHRVLERPIIGKGAEARAYAAKLAAAREKRSDALDHLQRMKDGFAYMHAAESRRIVEEARPSIETMIRRVALLAEQFAECDGARATAATVARNELRSIVGEPDEQAP